MATQYQFEVLESWSDGRVRYSVKVSNGVAAREQWLDAHKDTPEVELQEKFEAIARKLEADLPSEEAPRLVPPTPRVREVKEWVLEGFRAKRAGEIEAAKAKAEEDRIAAEVTAIRAADEAERARKEAEEQAAQGGSQ